MTTAVYPGSFDPVTSGHLDIIRRSSKMFDRLIVAVLNNNLKTPLFSADCRVKMLLKSVEGLENVSVLSFEGLLVDFVRGQNADVVVRGLRAITDFDYELQMAQTNHMLDENIDTVFLTTGLEYSYISSSTVKEIAMFGGDISGLVPECVKEDILKKAKRPDIRQEKG